jgi:hypothetical protein
MPLIFKSQATGDLLMLTAHAHALLKLIGKLPDAKGILEPADMPAALSVLTSLPDQTERAQPADADPEAQDNVELAFPDEPISLAKRAWPLIKMIEQALAANKPIVWGV